MGQNYQQAQDLVPGDTVCATDTTMLTSRLHKQLVDVKTSQELSFKHCFVHNHSTINFFKLAAPYRRETKYQLLKLMVKRLVVAHLSQLH